MLKLFAIYIHALIIEIKGIIIIRNNYETIKVEAVSRRESFATEDDLGKRRYFSMAYVIMPLCKNLLLLLEFFIAKWSKSKLLYSYFFITVI